MASSNYLRKTYAGKVEQILREFLEEEHGAKVEEQGRLR